MSDRKPLDIRLIEKPRDFVHRQILLTAQNFARIEASSGLALMAAALVALIWANSPWDDAYFDLLDTHISIDANIVHLDLSLKHWINDGLMVLFFFLMGLEIKREMVHGELSSFRRAILPVTAAMGGMIAPALIYTAINSGGEGSGGWGIPVATDIAFAVGVLSLLSSRVPFGVRIFLLALAIADDIGGILVIAFFYTEDINFTALGIAAVILFVVYVFNRAGVRTINIYVVLGGLLWVAVHESGVHATIGGVILGLLTPARSYYNPAIFPISAEELAARYRDAESQEEREAVLAQTEDLAKGAEAPLERIERALVGWVSFSIVPIFALANAGVAVSADVARDAFSSPVSQGAALGLILGKPIGIFLFTLASVKLGFADLPRGATWPHVLGVGILAGIGFTVALLITDLSFRDNPVLADEAKLGVLFASIVAGIAGLAYLFFTSRNAGEEPSPVEETATLPSH